MQREQFMQQVEQIRSIDQSSTYAEVADAVAAIDRLVGWCEAQRLHCAQLLRTLVAAPEQVLAQASRSGEREAEQVLRRADAASAAPSFAEALAAGRIATGHIDRLAAPLRRLEPAARARLLADSGRLVAMAGQLTPDEFGRALGREERRLASDDGEDRLERQRRSVRCRDRVDRDSGMHVWTLTVDPLTGLMLRNRVQAATETQFHTGTPPLCPSDPVEKQSFLRAHALLSLIDGNGVRLGRPEIVVVVEAGEADERGAGAVAANDPNPVGSHRSADVDWGLPVELPWSVLAQLAERGDVNGVVVRNGVVLHAPGQLRLGRTTRLANAAQRRALRALYSTCAVPGCAARYDLCSIHHVTWFRNGGSTDLDNLLPLCSKHHHAVHDNGWQLRLDADRSLTISLPDGHTMSTGPPKRRAG
jgi:hypothetical protein